MNKYEILGIIGEGEYGVVQKARNRQNEQIVAIKKFKQDTDQQNKKVILRQVKVLKMMKHENITEFKQAFRKKGRVYLVCEFVQKNLLQLMEQLKNQDAESTIQPDRVRYFLYQLLKGLEYMHSIDLIHRDLKPQNLLLNADDVLKICDFGFTRTVSNSKMTDYVATRWYRAPQLVLSRDDYDKSVDIWAAGCIFAEMIDSQPLFPGQSQVDQLFLMQRCLGGLCPDHQEYFLKHPRFIGTKFPQVNSIESLDRRYRGKIDSDGLDLMKRMLKMNPRQRITASEALKHRYFAKVPMIFKNLEAKKVSTQCIQGPIMPFPEFKVAKDDKAREDRSRDERHNLNTNKVTGVNKIKGVNTGVAVVSSGTTPEDTLYPTKSKIIQNIQNKIGLTTSKTDNRVAQSKQPDKLIKKQQFQYLLQKKTKSPDEGRNYIQDFEQQEHQVEQTPTLKSRDNYRRKKYGEEEDIQEDVSTKTPNFTKMLKKKLSKYNGMYQVPEEQVRRKPRQDQNYGDDDLEYVALGSGFPNPIRQQDPKQQSYNIIFNNNTFNYNYRK